MVLNDIKDPDTRRFAEIYVTLPSEGRAKLRAFCEALMFDRKHPGANTAQSLREELMQLCVEKEKVAA